MMELFPSFSKKYFTIKCLLTDMNGCIGSLNSHLTCWSLLQTFFLYNVATESSCRCLADTAI
ncbi:26S proteasome non-ATPase regulatory subunit 1-like protein A-like [Iris pallida]|uniref:26S proteasome non-ATPase regulatory subunit 1-like protein A-like n=1 Tax=Iris pallida TaxID=29817 RepID=A0AAX6ILM9_IRIPA|nr:26S proteasome non-ATPase regulatory subunit 1-like protein A-like [Iris pallida]